MNTHKLAKMYDRLTARERTLLIVAASHRGDAVERERLTASAPRLTYEAPHHDAFAHALAEAADIHMMTVLDLAALVWQCWGVWGCHMESRPGRVGPDPRVEGKEPGRRDALETRLHNMVRLNAYVLITHIDGWNRFCAELPVDPQGLLDFLPGWDTVSRTEALAREQAFSRDEAALFLINHGSVGAEAPGCSPAQVVTAESQTEAWRTFFNGQARKS
jgi:hypothetical protein